MDAPVDLLAAPDPSQAMIQQIASLGLKVYRVVSPQGEPRWLVTDGQGRILEEASTELIALAKLQIQALRQIGASLETAAERWEQELSTPPEPASENPEGRGRQGSIKPTPVKRQPSR